MSENSKLSVQVVATTTKVDKQLSDKQKKEIASILGTHDYSTITMKTQNGTQLTFEEAQRTRL